MKRIAWLGLVAFIVSNFLSAREEIVRLTPEQAQHIGIRTQAPTPTQQMPLVRAPATVSLPPQNEYVVSATQAGLISKIEVALGVKVKTGAVLAQIQSPELLGLQRAVLNAATDVNLSRSKLHRDHTLLQEGIISQMRYQETESNYQRAATVLKEAEQVLAAAGLSETEIQALQRHRKFSAQLTVRAPFEGVILERMAMAGQRVELLAPLFRIGKLDELWLEIDMPMERLSEMQPDDRVLVEGIDLEARVAHVSQNISPASQSARVRAIVGSHTEALKPGQHVNVQLMHTRTDKLFKIPLGALFSQDGKDYVFVQTDSGYAPKIVQVASREAHEAAIHQGLQAEDKIVVEGTAALKASWLGIGEDE